MTLDARLTLAIGENLGVILVFAAAKFLVKQGAGLYTMADVLGL